MSTTKIKDFLELLFVTCAYTGGFVFFVFVVILVSLWQSPEPRHWQGLRLILGMAFIFSTIISMGVANDRK